MQILCDCGVFLLTGKQVNERKLNGKWIAVPVMPGEEMLYVGRWQVIDMASRAVLHEWHGTNGAFSPDGKIFTAEVENHLTFWRTDTWEKITSFGLGDSRTWSFSPNGNVAVAAGSELNIWSVEPRQLIRQSCGCHTES